MFLCASIHAQEKDEYIDFIFDFSSSTMNSIVARVFIFDESRLELEAGNIGKVSIKKKDEYYLRYEYFEKSAREKTIVSDLITLYLPPDIDKYLFTVPGPSINPAGMATVTFLNNFNETVRVYVINNNNEYGYIGSFDDTRGDAEKNSVIAPHGSDTFVVPATKYKIEVRKTDNAGTVLYALDYIDLPAAIESSTIELSPDMANMDKRQRVRAIIRYPENASPDDMPLSPEFVIQFSAPMIVPLVESNMVFTALEAPGRAIPIEFRWSDDNKNLQIQPTQGLNYDTEYSLTLGLEAHDRQGNRLARAREWKFITMTRAVMEAKPKPVFAVIITWNGKINMGDGLRREIETLLRAQGFEVNTDRESATHIIEGIFSAEEREEKTFITFDVPGISFSLTKKDTDAKSGAAKNFYNMANLDLRPVPGKSWRILHERAYNMIEADVKQNFIKELTASRLLD
jgi:hypothetical protein